MSTELPRAIAAYFAGTNAHDFAACSDCFSEDAVVRDEGRERRGIAEIRVWKQEVIEKYRMAVDIRGVDAGDTADKFIVTGRVTGNFPGSPVDLPFAFTLDSVGKIARLAIGS